MSRVGVGRIRSHCRQKVAQTFGGNCFEPEESMSAQTDVTDGVQPEKTVSGEAEPETYTFQADVVQMLDLMIHSLYSNKEIFLRELISNASDAIDRLRLELLSRGEQPADQGPLQIRVGYDRDAGTITVADNGIGMSREEVI